MNESQPEERCQPPICQDPPSDSFRRWTSAPGVTDPELFLDGTHQSIAPTAAERVLAAELKDRDAQNDALSMMVSSMARMVQAGKTRDSRWKAS